MRSHSDEGAARLTLPGRSLLLLALLAGALTAGAAWRHSFTVLLNFDPRGYTAVAGGSFPDSEETLEAPPAAMLGPDMRPGVMPFWAGAVLICTDEGWRQTEGAGLIVWGHVLGSRPPDLGRVPSHPCPAPRWPLSQPRHDSVVRLPRSEPTLELWEGGLS